MSAFLTMTRASFTMLRRNMPLILSSLGLAVVSILAFGLLFSNSGNFKTVLGVVDEDHSATTQRVVTALQQTSSITVQTGGRAGELHALQSGQRDAVIVLPAGFGAALAAQAAQIPVYYDQSNTTSWLIAQLSVQQVVAGISHTQPPITLQQQAVSVHNLRTIDYLTPGMLGMMLMWANLGVGTVLVGWRQQGIMRRVAATPLRPLTLISAQMTARLILSIAQGALVLILAALLFQVQVIGSLWLVALLVSLGTFTMLSIGYIVGSFARTAEVANSITFLISFPMMFLSGSYFSIDNAPNFLKPVIQFLPLTHLNAALRQVINNGASFAAIQTDVLVLLAWAIVGVFLATRAFRWV